MSIHVSPGMHLAEQVMQRQHGQAAGRARRHRRRCSAPGPAAGLGDAGLGAAGLGDAGLGAAGLGDAGLGAAGGLLLLMLQERLEHAWALVAPVVPPAAAAPACALRWRSWRFVWCKVLGEDIRFVIAGA